MLTDFVIAYCGPPAIPGEFWLRWSFDPLLLAVLAVLAVLIGRGYVASARAGWAAIALLLVLFVSPFCALTSALFSARVLHHVILIAVVAPLLAAAFPLRSLASPPLAVLVGAHAIILWLWHVPGPYTWALETVPAYWLMQLTLLASAWLLWRAILAPAAQPGGSLVSLVATIGQMGLLGALIVFAPDPLYWVHFTSTMAWGLEPLADQQLAGLLMWVPAMVPYLVVGLRLTWSSLAPDASAR